MISKAKPEIIKVSVCINRELLSSFEEALSEYEPAEEGRKLRAAKYGESGGSLQEEDPADAVAARLADLNEQIEADKKDNGSFSFRKMGYEAFRDILEQHPPTESQKAQTPWLDHNPEAAAPALIAGSCIDPEMEAADAERLREVLPEVEWARLYEGAVRANRSGVVIPKSVSNTVVRLASELRLTTAPEEESPSPSSEGA